MTFLSDRSLLAHVEIVLAFYFMIGLILLLWRSHQIVLCWYTWKFCLTLFSDWVNLRSMIFSSDSSLLAQVEIVLELLFWLCQSLFYDVFFRSFPVGTRGDCACLSFLIGLIFVQWRSFQIVPCWHMWRLCLPFVSNYVNIHSMMFLSDSYLLSHVTIVSALLQRFGWDDQSCYFLGPVSISILSSPKVAGAEVSVTAICKIALVLFYCWTLVLILCRFLWKMSLINQVNIPVVFT